MVLLASGVVSKQNGKILLSRQFVEMTRSRIEGLLTAFTKLITKDKQHTFIETDTVRYVYQALMDKLYCVLITTKTSNILEDLETLRLFVRVINEYTSTPTKGSSDEQAINDNAFTLIFAFDEIVALGYRESVNMSQVRTFIEMDSHEERVFVAVRQTQEREAKQKMREKAKELSKIHKNQQIDRNTGKSMGGSTGNMTFTKKNIDEISIETNIGDRAIGNTTVSSFRPKGTSKALKLGSRSGQSFFSPAAEEQLATELKQEVAVPNAVVSEEPVTIIIEERLKCELSRDGGLVRSSELSGVMQILIQQEQYARVKFGVECEDADNVQIQTHPNVDKELFKQQGLITLRQKSFPINSSVGVLKYRGINTSGKDWPPLVINAWPNGNNCNLELQVNRALNEVIIYIPCTSQPIVNECSEGDYEWKRGTLQWHISVITPESPSATIDFDLNTTINNDDFFPISCSFKSETNLAGIKITEVVDDESDEEVKWALDSRLVVEKYDIS